MNIGVVIASGIALGVAYTLSPLTVLCVAAMIVALGWGSRGLAGRERDWFLILFVTAIVVRLVIIGGLVLSADGSRPYTVFFGDEWIFKSRPIWLRNIGLGIPISGADFIYAYDETGMSGHLYALALLQALVGDAPYGVHIFNVMLYVVSVLVLYRLIRPAFGPAPAMIGSAILLFLPSQFGWSISVLKEPQYLAAAVTELLCVLAVARAPRWWQRLLAVAAIVVLAVGMEELRKGTMIVVALGSTVGLAAGWIVQTRRRMLAAAVALPIAAVIVLAQQPVQARLLTVARDSVRYHVGHVMTPGVAYKIVDNRYYQQWDMIKSIGRREALQYTVRAAIAYVVEPLPRNWQSPLLWAFLPEHLVWLLLVACVPLGIAAAFGRDRLLCAVLVSHAAAIMMMVALTSGNIGTLIRHRGLSLPYLVWLGVLGFVTLLTWLAPAAPAGRELEAQ